MSDLEFARSLIRDVPDFPKPGILFRDVTPLLASATALRVLAERMASPWADKAVDYVAGMESRGFIFGTLVAQNLKCGFIPIRKPGKLPYKTESVSYGLEYGTDTLEIHIDAVPAGKRVLICDDLIATGGTAGATFQLIERIGGDVIGYSFAIELKELGGRKKLGQHEIDVVWQL
ncbi:MAG: adenine phosphoribosyltransferase [Deltaproteobacteria bacterium]|nr:adenine phosphoribosyltransferase [Deltaproteobacteria bacterium]